MTHEKEHVIIHFATPVEVAKVKTKAGYCGIAVAVIAFLIGLAF